MTHISGDRMDMEWDMPKLFNKAKAIIKEDASVKFSDETKPLYLEQTHLGHIMSQNPAD